LAVALELQQSPADPQVMQQTPSWQTKGDMHRPLQLSGGGGGGGGGGGTSEQHPLEED
jgi:hypothetical protein